MVDVGGRGFGADGKSVYEEGIQIPIMKFAERGVVNADLIRILRTNVREANQVIGDFYSLAACNDVGHNRLIAMMDEIGVSTRLRSWQLHHRPDTRCHASRSQPRGSWTNVMVRENS